MPSEAMPSEAMPSKAVSSEAVPSEAVPSEAMHPTCMKLDIFRLVCWVFHLTVFVNSLYIRVQWSIDTYCEVAILYRDGPQRLVWDSPYIAWRCIEWWVFEHCVYRLADGLRNTQGWGFCETHKPVGKCACMLRLPPMLQWWQIYMAIWVFILTADCIYDWWMNMEAVVFAILKHVFNVVVGKFVEVVSCMGQCILELINGTTSTFLLIQTAFGSAHAWLYATVNWSLVMVHHAAVVWGLNYLTSPYRQEAQAVLMTAVWTKLGYPVPDNQACTATPPACTSPAGAQPASGAGATPDSGAGATIKQGLTWAWNQCTYENLKFVGGFAPTVFKGYAMMMAGGGIPEIIPTA